MMPCVLAVGLDRAGLDVLAETLEERSEPLTVIACADARVARTWLADCGDEAPLMLVAAFHERAAWGLSALFTRLRSQAAGKRTDLVLVSDLPVASLPVLITDVSGLHIVVSGSSSELRHHLDLTLSARLATSAS